MAVSLFEGQKGKRGEQSPATTGLTQRFGVPFPISVQTPPGCSSCWRCCASWILDARYRRGVNYGTYYSSNEVLRLRRPDHHSYCFNFTSSFSHHWLFTVIIPKYIMSYYYFMYISLDVFVYSQRHLIITSKGYASTPMTGNKWVSTYWVRLSAIERAKVLYSHSATVAVHTTFYR